MVTIVLNICRKIIYDSNISQKQTVYYYKVYIEKNAGRGSGFSDKDYVKAGAEILNTPKEIFDIAEMIMKVKEPIEPEYELIKKDQLVFLWFYLLKSNIFNYIKSTEENRNESFNINLLKYYL